MAHQSIKKAVIPVAGLGTRFLPVTKGIPKEMIPIVDKPMVQFIIEEAVDSGIEQVILVTARDKQAIENYFKVSPELEAVLAQRGKSDWLSSLKKITERCEIIPVIQDKPLGLGHAIHVAQKVVGNDPFAILLGDDMIDARDPCTGQLIRVFEKQKKSVVGVMSVPKNDTQKYGIVAVSAISPKLHQVKGVIEKPKPEQAPSQLAIPGRYVVSSNIFTHIQNTKPSVNGEIQLSDALDRLAKDEGLLAYEFEGDRYDTGDRLGFLEATLEFALRRPEIKAPLLEIMKKQMEKHS